MAHFVEGAIAHEYDPSIAVREERRMRAEFDTGLGDFFDPAMDTHSAFYFAMERDKHAAHLVAGTSFLDLNNVILRTECNNAYESMNDEDMQKLRKIMWDVYVPHIQQQMQARVADTDVPIDSFHAQMYVIHLSVRVAQALQLVFELNQKKSFSAVVKTAYEVALQDVLYHPALRGKVKSYQYKELINYLRRHETYSTAFNTYVGYKLLRQQLVRSGGAGTNRKSNDAERLHDEAANRMWGILEENKNVFDDFTNALKPYTMEWHRLYYKEVAETLFHKLADHRVSSTNGSRLGMDNQERADARKKLAESLQVAMDGPPGAEAGGGGGGGVGGVEGDAQIGYNSGQNYPNLGVDIVSALQETRDTAAEGTSKRPNAVSANSTITLSSINPMRAKRLCVDNHTTTSNENVGGVESTPKPGIRSAFDSLFK